MGSPLGTFAYAWVAGLAHSVFIDNDRVRWHFSIGHRQIFTNLYKDNLMSGWEESTFAERLVHRC